jgi:uncharacterized OB-fold protein
MDPLLKPTLYAFGDTEPVLLGGQCRCGYIFFPMQTFGCERCGKNGDALQPKALRARGNLVTASIVHLHADKNRSTPFAIGTVALEEGPVIRAVLSDLASASSAPHRPVAGEWAQVTLEDGTKFLDLRFYSEAKDTASQVER